MSYTCQQTLKCRERLCKTELSRSMNRESALNEVPVKVYPSLFNPFSPNKPPSLLLLPGGHKIIQAGKLVPTSVPPGSVEANVSTSTCDQCHAGVYRVLHLCHYIRNKNKGQSFEGLEEDPAARPIELL